MYEIQHARDQEDEAFGAMLIEAIAKRIGIEPDTKKISRAIYKRTDCGAWIWFDAKGITVGTIVEGSDAEFSERIDLEGVELSEEGEKLVADRTFAALDRCEGFANEHFGE
jgi:hypothetical protein